MSELKPGDRRAIIKALRAGVVPKKGLPHIQVGRSAEIEEIVKDVSHIIDQGTAIRFVIGEYGSGKTFFMNLARLIALEKGLVTMDADLAPDRRIHATGGQARRLYAELARNISTRSKPGGGAMPSIVERFVSKAIGDSRGSDSSPGEIIRERLSHLEELAHGYEFAAVIGKYWEGHESGNEELKRSALRWLRGEYSNKTEARQELGVRAIIDDAGVYDYLKLMSAFVRAAKYKGLLVCLDEMVNIYKLTSPQARKANYEQILRILNDVLQGNSECIGFLMGGTPAFLMDPRRGLYSYEALQSRLAQNTFAKEGVVDFSGPVLKLSNLTAEELFILLGNVQSIMLEEAKFLPREALHGFMSHCNNRIGEAYFRTPRNTVRAFIDLLAVLEQNPGLDWRTAIEGINIDQDGGDDMSDVEENYGSQDGSDDGLVSRQV